MIRIERTFLIDKLPSDLAKHRKSEIEQGYFSDAIDGLRLRKKDNTYSLTRKIMGMPGDNSMREHIELPIYEEEFKLLWKAVTKKLTKTRYYYNEQLIGPELRIDIFGGVLKGLVLVELIFSEQESAQDYTLPEWLGREITTENWANNSNFASKSYTELKKNIEI